MAEAQKALKPNHMKGTVGVTHLPIIDLSCLTKDNSSNVKPSESAESIEEVAAQIRAVRIIFTDFGASAMDLMVNPSYHPYAGAKTSQPGQFRFCTFVVVASVALTTLTT